MIEESQREELVRELRHERGAAKTREANEKVRKVRAGGEGKRVWASKVGGQMGSVVYETSSEASSGFVTPTAYDEAEKRRDELLEFDRTFAERTKIIGISSIPVLPLLVSVLCLLPCHHLSVMAFVSSANL